MLLKSSRQEPIWIREHKSWIIVAYVWNTIAGALSWENDGRLKIGQVEVHSHHRGNGIWSELIREGERVNEWTHQAIGYLNNRRNESSARMFERAGYTRKDELKFYKAL